MFPYLCELVPQVHSELQEVQINAKPSGTLCLIEAALYHWHSLLKQLVCVLRVVVADTALYAL
jgi:hypothetical protein